MTAIPDALYGSCFANPQSSDSRIAASASCVRAQLPYAAFSSSEPSRITIAATMNRVGSARSTPPRPCLDQLATPRRRVSPNARPARKAARDSVVR